MILIQDIKIFLKLTKLRRKESGAQQESCCHSRWPLRAPSCRKQRRWWQHCPHRADDCIFSIPSGIVINKTQRSLQGQSSVGSCLTGRPAWAHPSSTYLWKRQEFSKSPVLNSIQIQPKATRQHKIQYFNLPVFLIVEIDCVVIQISTYLSI